MGNAEGVRNYLTREFVDKIVDDDGNFPIHIACRNDFVAVAKILLGRNCNIEYETKSGDRPIHLVSSNGHSEILKLLLDQNCNIECDNKSGDKPIHLASYNGHSEILKLLLDRNGNIECEDKSGCRPIHLASWKGHSEILKLLLDRSCNIECETKDGWRPIHWASHNGDTVILKLLLDSNCNIECETKSVDRPIHWAIRKGHSEILKLLLNRNCSIECEDKSGRRPIHLALINGHLEILKSLLDRNCEIECEDKSGLKPIHYASSNGNLQILKLLLARNCEIECWDKNGVRPIHCASNEGHSEILKLLLERNCKIECEDKSGLRPIHCASSSGHSEILKLLLARNCEIECGDKDGVRPIHCATNKGHSDILKLLLESKCNIECEDKLGNRPIHYVSNEGHSEILKLLINRNCNVECENKSGMRSIHCAANEGHLEILKLLLKNHCDIESETKSGWRPIHWASRKGHSKILKLLLDYNCEIECKTKSGERPIHWAIRNGHSEILKLLLDLNCDIECETKSGERPIHWASSRGHSEILKLLLEHNCEFECEDKIGNRPIHCASNKGHSTILKLLLEHNCEIECENKSGERPIHCAIIKGHSEIIKLLLQWKCQIDCVRKDGKSPLDLAKQYNRVDCVELLTQMEKLFSIIERDDPIEFETLFKSCDFIAQNIYTGLNVLEMAIQNNADKIIKYILDKSVDNKGIDVAMKELTEKDKENENLLKERILYLCITRHMKGFKRFISAEVINGQRRIVGPSFLELVVEHESDLLIDLIMTKTIYDKSIWVKAIAKAKEKGLVLMQEEIQERMILMESRQKVNFTILHTAISDNDADMLQYILDHPNNVDLNSNNETFGTALSLAYSLHQRNCIEVLQQYQLNVNTRNKYLETPLHAAIASGLDDNCGYLIDRSTDIDQTGFMELTGLQCAVIRGLIRFCTQLVNRGADYMKSVNLSFQNSAKDISTPFAQSFISLTVIENSLTLSLKFHRTLFPCFIKKLDLSSSNAHDGDNNSLLHLAVKCLQPDICTSLLNAGAQVDSVNNFGNSPLLELYADRQIPVDDDSLKKLIDITKILIFKGANVNFKSSNGITAFQSASNIETEKLMLALVSNHPRLTNFSSNDFQTAFLNQWFTYAEVLIELLSDSFLSSAISNEIFQSCESAGANLIKSLFNKSSSALQQSVIENLLYRAINSDDVELFDHLIRTEISEPRLLGNGENLFTFILQERKIEFAWKLWESLNRGKFVKLRNANNQIPLQIAIEMEEMDLVNALIIETKEFDSEDKRGKCAMTQLLEKTSISNNTNFKRKLISAINKIILLGGEIYKVTSRGQRIIDACTDRDAKSEIERFHKNNAKPPDNERAKCNVCKKNQMNIAFQCGHSTCNTCSNKLLECPFCYTDIVTRTEIFFS